MGKGEEVMLTLQIIQEPLPKAYHKAKHFKTPQSLGAKNEDNRLKSQALSGAVRPQSLPHIVLDINSVHLKAPVTL